MYNNTKTKTQKTSKDSVKTQKPLSTTKPTRSQILAVKKSQFIDEVRVKVLKIKGETDALTIKTLLPNEQSKIFHAFTTAKKDIKIAVTDCKGVNLLITLDQQEIGKILIKHYKASDGTVTANEILQMFDIVRNGKKSFSYGNYVYSITKRKNGETYKTVVKIFPNGKDAVLKSFHSTIGH